VPAACCGVVCCGGECRGGCRRPPTDGPTDRLATPADLLTA
jgi:hypothetical protein